MTFSALATAFLVSAGMLVSIPSASAAAPITLSKPNCAAPIALSAKDQVALQKRLEKSTTQSLVSELLCLTTVGSNPKPAGELRVNLKPRYKGIEVPELSVSWLDSKGSRVGSSRMTPDGSGGWKAAFKLAESHSGKQIRAQISDVNTYFSTSEEKVTPAVWDKNCLADSEVIEGMADGSIGEFYCRINSEIKETIQGELRIENATLSTTPLNVTFNPVVVAKPTVAGTALVNVMLTTKLSGTSKAQKVSYQWLRNGVAIKGAVYSKYKVSSSDLGKQLSVKLTGASAGQKTVVQTSPKTAKVLRQLNNPNPRVTLKNGKISCPMHNCTANMNVSTAKNAGATVKYQWYRNGKAIKGATKSAYSVKFKYNKKASYNVKYTAIVTVSKANHKTVSQASTSTVNAWVKLPK